MATTTATIFVGKAHQNHSGIIPTHLITLKENSVPCITIKSLNRNDTPKEIIPTTENTIDDIYLSIAVYILKIISLPKEINNKDKKSLYDLFNAKERKNFYENVKIALENTPHKVVFNILDGSLLLNQIDLIKKYPNDYEITIPFEKYEYNAWSNKKILKKY